MQSKKGRIPTTPIPKSATTRQRYAPLVDNADHAQHIMAFCNYTRNTLGWSLPESMRTFEEFLAQGLTPKEMLKKLEK